MKRIAFLVTLLILVGCKHKTENESLWVYSQSDGNRQLSHKANIDAKEKLYFQPPYKGGQTAILHVATSNGNTIVYLSVTKGEFVINKDKPVIKIKVDSEPKEEYAAILPGDNRQDGIYIKPALKLIEKLKEATVIFIDAGFKDEGVKSIEFDVKGFEWAL